MEKKEEPNPKKIKLDEEANMETLPDEMWLMVFSYLEVQDLGRCASVSKQFQKIAYEKALWQKLPINLEGKSYIMKIPVEFIQYILKRGTAYLNLSTVEILGDQLLLDQPNSLKYLNYQQPYDVVYNNKNNLLTFCTQLEKLACYISKFDNNDISQCIKQNIESLKCLQIHCCDMDEKDTIKLVAAINDCKQLEELSFFGAYHFFKNNILLKNLPGNLKKLYLNNTLKIEDLKVVVAKCRTLEDLFCSIDCCRNSTCHHLDQAISIIVGSPLSDTLVNLSLKKLIGDFQVHEQFHAKCLELGQMKKLKKIEIKIKGTEQKKVKDLLRKNLPHLTIVEDRKKDNFLTPADPGPQGLWEKSCNPVKFFPDDYCTDSDWSDNK